MLAMLLAIYARRDRLKALRAMRNCIQVLETLIEEFKQDD